MSIGHGHRRNVLMNGKPRSLATFRLSWFALLSVGLAAAGCGADTVPSGRASSDVAATSVPQIAESAPITTLKPEEAVSPGWFVNVAEQVGLTRVLHAGGANKDHILESVGSGCAWIDFDEDGLQDAFLANAWTLDEKPKRIGVKGRHALYRNLGGGRFEDVTDQAGIDALEWGCGVCAGDYDNDGHVDLYLTNFGQNRLYRSRGNGTFEEVAARAGVATEGWSTGAAFFDADGDGWLDLYVAKYIDCTFDEVLAAERTNLWRETAKVMAGPFGMRGGRDCFFHNNRDGTFTDATDAVGMTDTAESYGLGVLASDLDLDGDVDVYVGNDSNPNFLYRNDGQGSFTEIGGWSGAGVSADGRPQASMGVDAGDFDGDGLPEIITTNFAQDYCTLYKNEGQLFFSDISAQQRMKEFTYRQVSWGCAFFDYNLDTHLDLLILNGHIYPQVDGHPELGETYQQLPTLLRNVGGNLEDVSSISGPGLQQAESMRGLAIGDYDDDGKPDLLMTAIDAPPLLLRNETKTGFHWSTIRLLNEHGSPAINAFVKLKTGSAVQTREIRSGSTYCSQSSFDLFFGLGDSPRIDVLEIRWPNGGTTVARDLPAGKMLVFQAPPASPSH